MGVWSFTTDQEGNPVVTIPDMEEIRGQRKARRAASEQGEQEEEEEEAGEDE